MKILIDNSKLIYLAILVFGLNLAWTFLTGNMSSVFNLLGVSSIVLPYLWLAAPITGLLVQPIIGQLSDNTNTIYGKRRPYIFIWGIIAAITFCLVAMTNHFYFTIILIWIIGSSVNGSTEAVRALTADLTNHSNRAKAFALQAALGGFGAAIGSGLPFLINKFTHVFKIKFLTIPQVLPINFKFSFLISGILIFITLIFSLFNVKENATKYSLFQKKKKHQLLTKKLQLFIVDLWENSQKMPFEFKRLCLIQTVIWIGIFIFWLYLPAVIAQNLFNIPFDANITSSEYASLFQKSSIESSYYTSFYQYISVCYSFIIYFLSSRLNLKWIYFISLLSGSVGIAIISLTPNHLLFLWGCILFGIMWGGVVLLPSILAIEVIPQKKIGVYLGILNVSITAPQIICGLLLGPIYTYVYNQHAYYLTFTASLLVLCGAFMMGRHAIYRLPTLSLDLIAK